MAGADERRASSKLAIEQAGPSVKVDLPTEAPIMSNIPDTIEASKSITNSLEGVKNVLFENSKVDLELQKNNALRKIYTDEITEDTAIQLDELRKSALLDRTKNKAVKDALLAYQAKEDELIKTEDGMDLSKKMSTYSSELKESWSAGRDDITEYEKEFVNAHIDQTLMYKESQSYAKEIELLNTAAIRDILDSVNSDANSIYSGDMTPDTAIANMVANLNNKSENGLITMDQLHDARIKTYSGIVTAQVYSMLDKGDIDTAQKELNRLYRYGGDGLELDNQTYLSLNSAIATAAGQGGGGGSLASSQKYQFENAELFDPSQISKSYKTQMDSIDSKYGANTPAAIREKLKIGDNMAEAMATSVGTREYFSTSGVAFQDTMTRLGAFLTNNINNPTATYEMIQPNGAVQTLTLRQAQTYYETYKKLDTKLKNTSGAEYFDGMVSITPYYKGVRDTMTAVATRNFSQKGDINTFATAANELNHLRTSMGLHSAAVFPTSFMNALDNELTGYDRSGKLNEKMKLLTNLASSLNSVGLSDDFIQSMSEKNSGAYKTAYFAMMFPGEKNKSLMQDLVSAEYTLANSKNMGISMPQPKAGALDDGFNAALKSDKLGADLLQSFGMGTVLAAKKAALELAQYNGGVVRGTITDADIKESTTRVLTSIKRNYHVVKTSNGQLVPASISKVGSQSDLTNMVKGVESTFVDSYSEPPIVTRGGIMTTGVHSNYTSALKGYLAANGSLYKNLGRISVASDNDGVFISANQAGTSSSHVLETPDGRKIGIYYNDMKSRPATISESDWMKVLMGISLYKMDVSKEYANYSAVTKPTPTDEKRKAELLNKLNVVSDRDFIINTANYLTALPALKKESLPATIRNANMNNIRTSIGGIADFYDYTHPPMGHIPKSLAPVKYTNELDKINKVTKYWSGRYKVPYELVKAVINQESGAQGMKAKSSAGAIGIFQLMPDTARGLGVTNIHDTEQNIKAGVLYLASNHKKFGSWELALAAYNAGPGAVQKYKGVPPYRETQNYVKNIMSNYRRYRGIDY